MLLTFVVTTLFMIMIPGPDAALIMRSSLAHGRSAGMLTMLGGLCGISIHATLAAVGISALLAASPTAFAVVQMLGIVYLLWLGVHTWLTSGRSIETVDLQEQPTSRYQHVRRGLLSNLLNPKVLLLFVGFLPQFLPSEGETMGSALLLSAIIGLLYALWFSFYNLLIDKIGKLLRTPKIRRRVERATGVMLVGFALSLAVQ